MSRCESSGGAWVTGTRTSTFSAHELVNSSGSLVSRSSLANAAPVTAGVSTLSSGGSKAHFEAKTDSRKVSFLRRERSSESRASGGGRVSIASSGPSASMSLGTVAEAKVRQSLQPVPLEDLKVQHTGSIFSQHIARFSEAVGANNSEAEDSETEREEDDILADLWSPGSSESVPLQECWAEELRFQASRTGLSSGMSCSTSVSRTRTTRFGQDIEEIGPLHSNRRRPAHPWVRIMFNPSSTKRFMWDMLGILVLLADFITLPVFLAFPVEEGTVSDLLTWSTTLFWTTDIFLTCLTGYHADGFLVMSLESVVLRYAKSWMSFDVLVVFLDWYFLGMNLTGAEGGDAKSMNRSMRFLKFIRGFRLIRIMKLKRLLTEVQDRLTSEVIYIYLTIMKQLITLVIGLHVVACIWYAIGTNDLSGWVSTLEADTLQVKYQYVISLYWACAQVQGSADLYPVTFQERLFNIVILVFALVAFSSFLGSLTNLMTQLWSVMSEDSRQFWQLRRYLKQRSISHEIVLRIVHHVEHEYKQQRSQLKEADIVLLRLVPDQLRAEIKLECIKRFLYGHALFDCIRARDVGYIKVILSSLVAFSMAKGDTVFSCGAPGLAMYLVTQGELDYVVPGEEPCDVAKLGSASASIQMAKHSSGNSSVLVQEFQSLAEASLWVRWVHRGDLHTRTHVQLVAVDGADFHEAVGTNAAMKRFLSFYAFRFQKALRSRFAQEMLGRPPLATDLLDGSIARLRRGKLRGATRLHTSIRTSLHRFVSSTRRSISRPPSQVRQSRPSRGA